MGWKLVAKSTLDSFVQNKKCFIISDSNVFPLYGGQIIAEVETERKE